MTPDVWDFAHQAVLNFPWTPTGLGADPPGTGSISQDPPDFRYQSQGVGSSGHPNFCLTWLQVQGSQDPLLGFNNLLGWLTELKGTLMFTNLLYDKGWKGTAS